MESLLNLLDDLLYSAEGWLQSKTEAFNAWMGATLTMFLCFTMFIILMGVSR